MEVPRENRTEAEAQPASHSWGDTHTRDVGLMRRQRLVRARLPVRLDLPSGGEKK